MHALEMVTAILAESPQEVSGTCYVSAQQPLGDLAQALWHHRRGRFVQLRQIAWMFAPDGPLERLAGRNQWLDEFAQARALFEPAFRALNCVRYFDSEVPVQLGDRVKLRVLLRRTEGRVAYLPGVSPTNPQIDFGGLFRVGIATSDGGFVSCHVDPDSLGLKRGVVLLRRDPSAPPAVPGDEVWNE